tara:strand:- start:20 stop:643 length:624 start_codon:yes stop_codon:yes gene_type:complete
MKKIGMWETDNPLRRNRHYLLDKLIKTAPLKEANVSECGCWKGLSTHIISSQLKNINFDKKFYIFDSFEGLSEFKTEDRKINQFDQIKEIKIRKHFSSDLDMVKNNLNEFKNFTVFYKGWIPSRFNEVNKENFSFVHIDLDLFEPTLDSLNFFGNRMIKDGIILLDDYGSLDFPGAKLATKKFLEKYKNFSFLPLSFGSAILRKTHD